MRYCLKIRKTDEHRNKYGQHWRTAHGEILIDDELHAMYSLVLDGVGCLYQIALKTYLESFRGFCLFNAQIIELADGKIGFSLLNLPLKTVSEERILSTNEIKALPEKEQEWVWEIFGDIVANDPRIASIRQMATVH